MFLDLPIYSLFSLSRPPRSYPPWSFSFASSPPLAPDYKTCIRLQDLHPTTRLVPKIQDLHPKSVDP